jgi:hypothetical protein
VECAIQIQMASAGPGTKAEDTLDTLEIEEMLNEDLVQWAQLCAVLEAHPNESLHDQESPEWTSRDVYTHMARWMELSTRQLTAQLDGATPPIEEGSDDEINARWKADDSGLRLDEARSWAGRAFDERVGSIRSVASDRWTPQLERTARGDGSGHYSIHREFIISGRGRP